MTTTPTREALAEAVKQQVLTVAKTARSMSTKAIDEEVALCLAAVDRFATAAQAQSEPQWMPMDSAPKVARILGSVEGVTRIIAWTKTSHVPIYGWCLVDQGDEECDLCDPSGWLPLPQPMEYPQ